MIGSSATAEGLCTFVDASPSPFHVCATVAAELEKHGYRRLEETDAWNGAAAGKHYVIRGGSIIAWNGEAADGPRTPMRIVGGHTDSPNLRVKQNPDLVVAGLQVVSLEPYGGAWLDSWLDRDLGVSGRLAYDDGGRVAHTLVNIDEPVLRVPRLAIHLAEDRKTVTVDPQRHLNGVRGIGESEPFLDWVAGRAGLDPASVLGWDLMTHSLEPSRLIGAGRDLVSTTRLDNQGTCYSGLRALLDAKPDGHVAVLALFDHEEVGSGSERGASSDFLVTVCERLVTAAGGDREDFQRVMAASFHASGDMAHATHPNRPERHEPTHPILMGGGPVLKVNQNLRYASDAIGEAEFALSCRDAGVPLQRYIHRADLPCGSTIGPLTAARTGLRTVDVGAPQLAMHSCRETMAAADIPMYAAALSAFLSRR
ncbi:MAG: M18 family aminopeptidase [Gordonia sp. (in: high G+C Gram-positive bacteria)]|uniref:M18 family aminopeptidase n=1 Tax=Gordonia sp. (in: high G+C Gram-positive bacteria) TaxID=84139 RepID=UPI0039E6E529